jgi:PAS domain-containing protein
MPYRDIELILMRQLASTLATPVFLVDPEGNLIYYNEPAEPILGQRFEETGAMPVEQWSTMFRPLDGRGRVMAPGSLPLVIALQEQRPAYKAFWIRGLDGGKHRIRAAAFPLIGQRKTLVGAVAIFTEAPA